MIQALVLSQNLVLKMSRINSRLQFMVKDLDKNSNFVFLLIDADGNIINYKTEYLLDGRKQIFYEPTVVGRFMFCDYIQSSSN